MDTKAEAGSIDNNLLHNEMEEIAHKAKVNFIINTIMGVDGGIIKAVTGDIDQAFLEGVKFMDERFRVPFEKEAEVAIFSSGGHPWDITLYNACSGLKSAIEMVRDDGVIIWIAECPEGYGNNIFYDWMSRFKTESEVSNEIKKNFAFGGDMAYLLIKALKKGKLILVSIVPDYYATGIFGLRTARTVNAALKTAFRILSKDGKVLILPNGNTVLPVKKK